MDSTGKNELVLRQHPTHDHPLELLDSANDSSISSSCRLCSQMISTTTQASTCQHRLCVEAPPQIDLHPLHPLPVIHDRINFLCDACGEDYFSSGTFYRCDECNLDLDIACALSLLSVKGGDPCVKTLEQITFPLHRHPLAPFTERQHFVKNSNCYICKGFVGEDGYMCLQSPCEFVIHKRCIQDLYYADGTKAPRVYHGHPLKTFVVEDTDSSRTCESCGSDKLGEFICCESCQVFYHRNCFHVPEILRYPTHRPDHALVLFPENDTWHRCESCSCFFGDEIYYRCTSCEFFLHVGCASKVLAYCEEGMSTKMKLSWHKHPLLLCHQTQSTMNHCSYCGDKAIGPTYVCEEKSCRFQLHKPCAEIEKTITYPHHPDHPLTLCELEDTLQVCKACGEETRGLFFTCNRCLVYLHVKCAHRLPTHKHCLHEHKLMCLEKNFLLECNRCGRRKDSPLFRCVPCSFNLHEECMELPEVMRNDKIHWHPLTLHETFLEDDSGEYYCEHCEKTRDPRLGAYVCGYCKISLPRIYHIHCVLPELGKLYKKKRLSSGFQKLKERITDKEEEVRAMEEKLKEEIQKLDESRRELDELMNQYNKILEDDE